MALRHFLDISALDADDLQKIMNAAIKRKKAQKAGVADRPFNGLSLAMIFEKPSTRTRVSFDIGMRQLGGETIMLTGNEMQLGRDETIADTAKVLSRFVDIIMIRTKEHERLIELADAATVPVINGLTNDTHPCQIMADIMTYQEHRGSIKGKRWAYTGDGNIVVHSMLEAAARFEFDLSIATPQGSEPDRRYVDWARKNGVVVNLSQDAVEAVTGADAVITDTWVSMGFENDARENNIFMPYQVNAGLMFKAQKDALFLHCLPAHRGEEVTDEVMDGPQSVVFDEAENRLHVQKAIIEWCLTGLK